MMYIADRNAPYTLLNSPYVFALKFCELFNSKISYRVPQKHIAISI